MKTYDIEVIETLSKTIKIKAHSIEDAILKAEQLYKDEKIVLDENNCIDTKILPFNDDVTIDEKQQLMNEVIEYLFKEEEKHYEEYEDDDKPKEHIYLTLKRLKELN